MFNKALNIFCIFIFSYLTVDGTAQVIGYDFNLFRTDSVFVKYKWVPLAA